MSYTNYNSFIRLNPDKLYFFFLFFPAFTILQLNITEKNIISFVQQLEKFKHFKIRLSDRETRVRRKTYCRCSVTLNFKRVVPCSPTTRSADSLSRVIRSRCLSDNVVSCLKREKKKRNDISIITHTLL